MKTLLTIFAAALSFSVSYADVITNRTSKVHKDKASLAKFQASLKRVNLRRTGGQCRMAGSAKGWCVILNAQSKVPQKTLTDAASIIDREVRVQIKVQALTDFKLENAKQAVKEAGASVGVIVVNTQSLPALLGAPDEGWSVVNVAKLLEGNEADALKLENRVRREILRAFGLAGGAMYAAQGDFVLYPMMKSSDLDSILREGYGAMMMHIFPLALPYFGVTPWTQTTYRKAVEQGWAPAPTNEYQKAIWDEIHQLPTEPIKIKPETKPVKE